MGRRFVLLDRDGTILVDKHYLADPTKVFLYHLHELWVGGGFKPVGLGGLHVLELLATIHDAVLEFLHGREKLRGYDVFTLVRY